MACNVYVTTLRHNYNLQKVAATMIPLCLNTVGSPELSENKLFWLNFLDRKPCGSKVDAKSL